LTFGPVWEKLKDIFIYSDIFSTATRMPFGLLFVPKIHKGRS